MSSEEQEIIIKGLDEGLSYDKILKNVMDNDYFLGGGVGRAHAFVEYEDVRLGGVTGANFVQEKDLASMPHKVSLSGTRPYSFHIELIGYIDHLGPIRDGWPEIVERYKKQMTS
jgi:hypothetical protein